MSLELYFHGGKCCGIKTIAGFGWYKSDLKRIEPRKQKTTVKDYDSCGHNVSTMTPFFTDEAPEETTVERLDRLIAFCRRRRPQGAIEVTLAKQSDEDWGEEGADQNRVWRPILKKHGFKKTCGPFLNSNSGNEITIYHLVYDATAEQAASDTPNPFGRSE